MLYTTEIFFLFVTVKNVQNLRLGSDNGKSLKKFYTEKGLMLYISTEYLYGFRYDSNYIDTSIKWIFPPQWIPFYYSTIIKIYAIFKEHTLN